MFEIERPDSKAARAVLLGGRGFIGRALARNLQADGWTITAPSSSELDLVAPDAGAHLRELLGAANVVVMLASITPDRQKDALAAFGDNIRMGEAVARAVAAAPDVGVVYVSSDAVYPFSEGATSEASCAEPRDLYGAAHRARELMLASVAADRLAVLRPTQVFGAGDSHDAYGPTRMARQALRDGTIRLFGNGEDVRSYLPVDACAALLADVVRHRGRGLLNLAYGESASAIEVAQMVAASCDADVDFAFDPQRMPVRARRFDPSLLERSFPEHRPEPLAASIRELVDQLRASADP